MIELPRGSFARGSPTTEEGRQSDEGNGGTVTIGYRLAVGKYAVTFAEWDRCVDAGGCSHWPADRGWGRGHRPVINVSWNQIQTQFLPWLNRQAGLSGKQQFRLLSESEREYAARAGGKGPFSLGPKNDSAISPARANYVGSFQYAGSPTGDFRQQTLPVHSFEANAWGLYQMHGNVWERTQDCYEPDYRKVATDGSAHGRMDDASCARVLRGGSWSNDSWWLRSAYRINYAPDIGYSDVGFRLARMLSPES